MDRPIENDDASAHHSASKKPLIIGLVLAFAAVLGVIACFLPEHETSYDLVLGLPWLILGVWWCAEDAARRDERIGTGLKVLLVLLFFVGLPVYLIRSRGWRVWRSFAWLLVLFLAIAGMLIAGAAVTVVLGDITGWWYVA